MKFENPKIMGIDNELLDINGIKWAKNCEF